MATVITVPIQGTAHDAAYFQASELTDADLFTCAYTDGPHGYPVSTIRAIRAHGKGILWNHERGQLDLAGGWQAGITAANEATPPVAAAGTPSDGSVAIVYSVDGAVTQAGFADYVPAFQAIRAAHAGRFLIGFYGELALYKYLKARGLVDTKCWLSASSSFPGYNPNDPDVGLIQTVGTDIASTDRDLVTDATGLGVWWPPVDPPQEPDLTVTYSATDPNDPQTTWIFDAALQGRKSIPTNPALIGAFHNNGCQPIGWDPSFTSIPIVGELEVLIGELTAAVQAIQIGPQGPAGPAGPEGPAGPAGTAGTSGPLTLNFTGTGTATPEATT